jgi:hypothetical protein
MTLSLSLANVSQLDGRRVVVRSLRKNVATRAGIIQVRDAAGDQEGPSAVLAFDGVEDGESGLPLDETMIRLLSIAAASCEVIELTVD